MNFLEEHTGLSIIIGLVILLILYHIAEALYYRKKYLYLGMMIAFLIGSVFTIVSQLIQ